MHRMPVIHMKKCVAVSKNSKMVKNVKNSKVSTGDEKCKKYKKPAGLNLPFQTWEIRKVWKKLNE